MVAVVTHETGDGTLQPAPGLGRSANVEPDGVSERRVELETRGPDHGDDGQFLLVDRGRGELVHLGGPTAPLIARHLVLKIGDRGDAGEQLPVEEGDPVVAPHQAEPGLRAGGDLRPVALAVDRAVIHQVDVEHRRERVQIGRDVEVGQVVEVVQGGLEFQRGVPGVRLVSRLERLQHAFTERRPFCRSATVAAAS